jgi:phospholipid/cholesterol/gamma-HCH transport system substrate-binding protein
LRYQSVVETTSNKYLVAGFVVALLVGLFAYIFWASPSAGKTTRQYDIYFEKSVAGLLTNSPVTLSGVTVGRVSEFDFDPKDPERIRVRVMISSRDAPIYMGTTASLSRDLFGAALIKLDGPEVVAAPIRPARPGYPAIIPVKKGAVELGDPVGIVQSISDTSARLNALLTPENRRTISERLTQLERRSAVLAERVPIVTASVGDARDTVRNAAKMADAFGVQADAAEAKVRQMREQKLGEIHASLSSARASLDRLDQGLKAAQPKIATLSDPALQQQVRALRESTAGFGETVRKFDRNGLGAASEANLPDYEGK